MRYTRIYADDTGETHLEEVDIELELTELAPPAPPFDLSAARPATRMLFATLPVGWFGDWHPAPRRQFFLQLTGEVEVVVSDGGRVQTGAGSVTLLEDVNSKGHVTRVVGDSPVTGAFVQLAG
jgi:hypothetical protein